MADGGRAIPDAIFTGIVVFAQMLDVGFRARPDCAAAILRDTGFVLGSLAAVLIVVPLAVFVLIALIPMPPGVALGLVILAAAPVVSRSVWKFPIGTSGRVLV